jgi:WD40 repeat protein
MADDRQGDQNIHAEENSIAFGGISVGGNVGDIRIGHTIGFSSDQVSTLITQISTTFQPRPFDGTCPYKGLDVFEEEDAELFFGRETLIEDLVGRVKDSRTVFVTGPSGSGKSSLVRAGLMPALKQGALKEAHSERWLFASMKPGRDPIEALAGVFSRLKNPDLGDYFRRNSGSASDLQDCAESILTERKDQRFVLFIDQFEEVFTQLSPEKATSFIRMLDCAATIDNGRVIVLFAMRSDFVPNCAAFPQLNALLNKQFVQIGAMQPHELVSAIAQPALRVGLKIDPDLIAQIINDMEGEPGALPLMQFALKDLFDAQQEKGGMIALTLNDYLQRGGIRKALERHADQTFGELGAEEQELARSIFTGLIEVGRGTQDTRRTAIFDELVPANAASPEIQAIIRKLADARLITTDEVGGKDTVTISHEKLIDAWPWLKKLVNENREVIALQNQIATDAQEWEENNRDASYLYSGARLVNAHEQLKKKQIVLSGTANEFVQAGYARKQRDRRARILGIAGIIGLILAGILAISIDRTNNANRLAEQSKNAASTQGVIASTAQAASTLAISKQQEADKQAKISRAGELAALALSGKDTTFNTSLLLSLEANKAVDNPRTEGALLTLAASHPGLETYISGHNNWVNSIAFSPDGTRLISGGGAGEHPLILWDVSHPNNPTRLAALDGDFQYVNSVAFSPDGQHVASAVSDNTILLWDTSNPAAPSRVSTLSGHKDSVNNIAYSPDGKELASGSSDKSIILWNVSDPQKPSQLATISGLDAELLSVAFDRNGGQLAAGDATGNIFLWDVSDPANPSLVAKAAGDNNAVKSVAFSPDGTQLASGSEDRNIILWDIRNPAALTQISTLEGHKDWVNVVVFSKDGKQLVSGSEDATIIVWDISNPDNPKTLKTLQGHSSGVMSVAFNPDGTQMASGSKDENIILWDVDKSTMPAELSKLDGSSWVSDVAYSSDGKHLASTSADTVLLWDVSDPTKPSQSATLSGQSSINKIVFSPDGKQLASGDDKGNIILWNVNDPAKPVELAPLSGHKDSVTSIAFSPDGKRLASAGNDATIILWDITNPGSPAILSKLDSLDRSANSIAFSPDGKLLASGGRDQQVTLWDVSDPAKPSKLTTLLDTRDTVMSIAFSPDGKDLAAGTIESIIYMWDVKDPASSPLLATLKGHINWVNSITFSPDSKLLASGSFDNNVILWDVSNPATPSQLATLSGHSESVNGVAFSPDGKRLASGSGDQTIILWDLDLQSWIQKACQRVGRNFTSAEWTQYFPKLENQQQQEYRQTCQQWPIEGMDTGAAVSAVPSPTPTLAPTATATPLVDQQKTFVEEFDGNLDKWTPFLGSGVESQVNMSLANGRMQVKLSPYQDKVPRVYWVNDAVTYTDVQVDVVATNNGNNANGVSLICQYNDLGWYEFTVSNAGLYTIYAFDTNLYAKEKYIVLANGGSPAIKTGQVTNSYTAVCKGNELSLYANGTLLNTVTDQQLNFTEGKIGFGVSSPQKLPVDLQLESVAVSIPQ